MEERNTEEAFRWIVGMLQKHNIPFQISGGLAARVYGSQRELADIDIDVPEAHLAALFPEVKEFVVFGPAQYVDDQWDLQLMTLNYKGQEIDLAGQDTAKIFDKEKGEWVSASHDLAASEPREVYGLKVPVIPKAMLVAYKKKIMREVDMADLKSLEI